MRVLWKRAVSVDARNSVKTVFFKITLFYAVYSKNKGVYLIFSLNRHNSAVNAALSLKVRVDK